MQPVLFKLGNVPIHAYGVGLLLAFVASTWLTLELGQRRGYSTSWILDLCVWSILGGIVACRLGYVLMHPLHYLQQPWLILWPREGGLTILGALIAGPLGWTIYFRRHGVGVLNLLDFGSAPFLLGMAVGRLGCLLQGCCYGAVCDLPWAIAMHDQPGLRHPSQLYEIGFDLVLLAVLLLAPVRYAGQTCFRFLAGYGAIRFLLEYTREQEAGMAVLAPFNNYQWIALGMLALGLVGLWRARAPVQTDWDFAK